MPESAEGLASRCSSCKKPGGADLPDKHFRDSVCGDCFDRRRRDAARAGYSEWFEKNGLLGEMTEEEKALTGL